MIRTSIGVVLLSLAIASPAAAAGGGPAARPATKTDLTLTYMADAGFAAAVKLSCDPVGGGHPEPAAACATLRRTGADPGRIDPADTMCILLYQPVRAEMRGRWQGRVVAWSHTYSNTCEMTRATEKLFSF